MRSLPTIAVTLAVLAFIAWIASEGLRPPTLYACGHTAAAGARAGACPDPHSPE